ncbi:MAG: sigma-54-dependent Fis family transcriptional regulator [Elusimicrobia bacterium]|nr:sigma-54-dependent Fis family transcriptional regulator [Elusimicrobiota bacterium]
MNPRKACVLLVDDEDKLRKYLRKEFERQGYKFHDAGERAGAVALLAAERVDVVLLDIVLPGTGGMDILKELRKEHPEAQVIMLTGNATVETAVEAMKMGAYDYLTKPYNLSELMLLVDRAFGESRLRRENEVLRLQLAREGRSRDFVGRDPKLAELRAVVKRVAPTASPVLITGETGTGKELVARLIHETGGHADGPFVAVNCSAFQETLLESELFGHERGAFTDAVSQKKGLIEMADGGTLFLDEIGTMAIGMQAKLLRFLDHGEYRRVGGTRVMRATARIVSATNQDLAQAIKGGRFREDLLYRLNVVSVQVPPLRERKGDIALLVEHFVAKGSAAHGRGGRRLSPAAIERLMAYHWPGNVRELENVIERSMVMAEGDVVGPGDIVMPAGAVPLEPEGGAASLAAVEKAYILEVLARTDGNKTKAAAILGVDVKTLYNKLKGYSGEA